MSSFCPHCGSSLAVAGTPGGPPTECPACGRPASQTSAGVSPAPNSNRESPVSRSQPRFLKDAVIGLAILVVILAFWRLLTRPERMGSLGPVLKTHIFGAYGVSLAETLTQAGGRLSRLPQGTNSSAPPADEPLPGQSNSEFLVVSQPGGGGNSSRSDDPLLSTNPVKIIASLPAELSEARGQGAPGASSPDAAAMARRLDEAGARTGDIQISLSWNNHNDLDLHCFDPQGEQIWYSHKQSEKTGGVLDVDRNASEPFTSTPVENIYWPTGQAPPGIYRLYLVHYAEHSGHSAYPTPYTVRIVVEDKTNYVSGKIAYTGRRELIPVCSFQYDPGNHDPAKRRRFLSNR